MTRCKKTGWVGGDSIIGVSSCFSSLASSCFSFPDSASSFLILYQCIILLADLSFNISSFNGFFHQAQGVFFLLFFFSFISLYFRHCACINFLSATPLLFFPCLHNISYEQNSSCFSYSV